MPFKTVFFFESPEGQQEITFFIENLRSEAENKEGYLEICRKADENLTELTDKKLEEIFEEFNELIENTSPGHDANHIRRDTLAGLALVTNDPFIKKAYSEADRQAAILGSVFHDVGTAVSKRYEDSARPNGHAEVGAYIFWKVSEGILDENVRKLAAYAITAHTHFLKPIAVKEPQGYERQPYWYEIFYPEADKPCGLAPLLTRFSDRLDANGASFTIRTMLANADAVESGGQEFAGERGFFEINKESLLTLFLPFVRDEKPKPSTVLEHVLMFANSNFGNSVYSRDDHLFPVMGELMTERVRQTNELVKIVLTQPNIMKSSQPKAKEFIEKVMQEISGSRNFERSWKILSQVWDALSPKVQARWVKGFEYIRQSHKYWVELLQNKVGGEYREFAKTLAEKIL